MCSHLFPTLLHSSSILHSISLNNFQSVKQLEFIILLNVAKKLPALFTAEFQTEIHKQFIEIKAEKCTFIRR